MTKLKENFSSICIFSLCVLISFTYIYYIRGLAVFIIGKDIDTIRSSPNLTLTYNLIAIFHTIIFILFKPRYFGITVGEIKNSKVIIFNIYIIILLGTIGFIALGLNKEFEGLGYRAYFTSPIVEEIMFRGFIYSNIYNISKGKSFYKMPVSKAIIVSALLFSLWHMQYDNYVITNFLIFQMGYTFILGIFWGMLREKSKSIYPSLLLHSIINFMSDKIVCY